MEVELKWLTEVVARHTPTFFLHPTDQYLPCTAEWFMQHCELRCQDAAGMRVLVQRGSLSAADLLKAQSQQPAGSRLWMELHPAARTGMPLESLSEVPVYCHPKAVVRPDGSVEALELTYITLYACNGDYCLGGVPFCKTGSHDGDIEHCTVRIDPETGGLIAVWYNAHRCRDGCWVAGPQVPRDARGNIAAYVAKHGHGVYPRTGRVLRHFFLANDLCSSAGPVWRPQRVVLLPSLDLEQAATAAVATGTILSNPDPAIDGLLCTRTLLRVASRGSTLPSSARDSGSSDPPHVVTDDPCHWLWFRGRWGQTCAPLEQAWMHRAEPPLSRSSLQRIFCHFAAEPASIAQCT